MYERDVENEVRENVKLTRFCISRAAKRNFLRKEAKLLTNKFDACSWKKLMYTGRGEKLIRLVVRFLTNYYLGK